ncbi:FecR family protein [Flavobacterium sp. LM4]|uniref:FecR family protein n=1 Tax=Flavobacterium sp. LM4 TaxID=1938609 RepID=UPI00099193A9|nr:FecR family protein [Flavobacterium sp. LM4]OOV19363.1 iron dicitrate transport regulator FecR [Flavobacterium sp. LM4]
MDKEKLDKEFEKLWNETPISHSDSEKEASWEEFQSKTFDAKRPKIKIWRYAAAAAVIIFMLTGTGIYFNRSPLQDAFYLTSNTIENNTSIIKTVALPDSSRVELSPDSKIVYANNFETNRKIIVEGEVYFKVKKDKKHPFQVFCNETTTTVLGTSFTVQENVQKGVTVALYEGSVQMNVKDQNKVWILKPGEKFVYGNNTAEVAEFNRFTDFENEKLSAFSNYIMENYGYKMTIPRDFDNQRITVRINKKEDLKTIVQLISEMYNLNFEINEDLKQITFR